MTIAAITPRHIIRLLAVPLAVALLLAGTPPDAAARSKLSPEVAEVKARLSSGLKGARQFAAAFARAKPPPRVMARGPNALANFDKRLRSLKLKWYRAFDVQRRSSLPRRLTRASRLDDRQESRRIIKALAARSLKRFDLDHAKLLGVVKDSPDYRRLRNLSRQARGKLAEAAKLAQRL